MKFTIIFLVDPSLELIKDFCTKKGLSSAFAETLSSYHLPLLEHLASVKTNSALVLGINGAQGSGKSTLAEFLTFAAERTLDWQVSCLSIDDIYLGKQARNALSETTHPLLKTRGVPGTHDLDLGESTIRRLIELKPGESLPIPRFNKALDDRCSEQDWVIAKGKQDLIIFEGWCVACQPQLAYELIEPINELENKYDTQATWRHYVNESISSYQTRLWKYLDLLVMLKVPSFDQVYAWRTEQEKRLVESLGRSTELSDPAKMQYFISHYERLTKHMLTSLSESADIVLELDEKHSVCQAFPLDLFK